MKRVVVPLVGAAFGWALFSAPAPAQPPSFMHLQGMLTDDQGLPTTGTVSMTFAIYADTAAAALLTAANPAVVVTNGFYEAYLEVGGLPFDEPYFLGIEVGGAPLGPKKPLASVPYSIRSARTKVVAGSGLTGSGDSATVTLSVANGGVTTAMIGDGGVTAGKIADGAVTSSKLDSGAAVRSLNGRTGDVTLLEGSNVTISGGVGGLTISAAAGGADDGDWTVAGDHMYAGMVGNVGIGTASPDEKLDVQGSIALSGSIQGRSPLGTGIIDDEGVVGVWVRDGRVGVGTDMPSNDLFVLGSAGISGNLAVGDGSDSDSDYVFFDDYNSDWLMWAEESDRFQFSGPLSIGGAIGVGDGAFDRAPTPYSTFYLGVEAPTPSSGLMDTSGDVYIQQDLEVGTEVYAGGDVHAGGDLYVNGEVRGDSVIARRNLYCGYAAGGNDGHIYFNGSARSDWLKWKEVADRFEFSNDLSVGGVIAAGGSHTPDGPIWPFHYFAPDGGPDPLSGDMNGVGDVFVYFDIEAGSDIYYTGALVDLNPPSPAKGGEMGVEIAAAEARAALSMLRPREIPVLDGEPGKTGEAGSKLGFLPSEVPDAVKIPGGNGYRPLDIVAILTKVVQEQQKTIETLEARLSALESGR